MPTLTGRDDGALCLVRSAAADRQNVPVCAPVLAPFLAQRHPCPSRPEGRPRRGVLKRSAATSSPRPRGGNPASVSVPTVNRIPDCRRFLWATAMGTLDAANTRVTSCSDSHAITRSARHHGTGSLPLAAPDLARIAVLRRVFASGYVVDNRCGPGRSGGFWSGSPTLGRRWRSFATRLVSGSISSHRLARRTVMGGPDPDGVVRPKPSRFGLGRR